MMSGVVHVYKERQNWVADTGGTKEHPGADREREGFGDHSHALTHAVNIAAWWACNRRGARALVR
jgi:hypothetical protein